MDLPAFYNTWATNEVKTDSNQRKLTALWKSDAMLSLLPTSFTPKSLLEIGCAEGFILNAFEKKFKTGQATGVDLAAPFIEKAKILHPHLQFQHGDITTMHLAQKFDLAIIADVLEHLEFPGEFMKKLSTIAHNVIIKMPLEWSLFDNVFMRVFNKKTYPGRDHHEGHLWECTYNNFKQFLKKYMLIEEKTLVTPPPELEYPSHRDREKIPIRIKLLGNKYLPLSISTYLFGGHCIVFGEMRPFIL